MSGPSSGRGDVLAGVLALVGAPGELDRGALAAALGLVARAAGVPAAAAYLGDPAAGGLELSAAAGVGGHGTSPAAGPRAATTPGVCAALAAGQDVGPGGPLGHELEVLGLAGGCLLPVRVGGRTVAALGLAPAPVAQVGADLRAAAQLLGLALRNGQLASGFRDRVRELDRQAAQLGALTEVARRVAGTLEPGEARRVVVEEARALVRADAATLVLPGRTGTAEAVAVAGADEAPPPDEHEIAAVLAAGGARRRGRGATVAIPGAGASPAGVIAVVRRRGAPFDDDDLERLRGLAGQAAIALANAGLLADLRREQRERRSLAAAIVLAQEQERRRIAEELHDGPVQELVGVGLLLDALAGDLAGPAPEVAADVARAAGAARESVRGLRRAISDLHPLVLEQLGFAAAVRALLERLEWTGVEVMVEAAAGDRLPPDRRATAFRIVQEATANAARHAGASRIAVRALEQGGRVLVEIADDGRGFDPAAPRAGVAEGHLGLAAMEERARLAGGELAVESSPGHGTTIRVSLPAEAGADRAQAEGPASRSSASDRASWSAKRSSTTT